MLADRIAIPYEKIAALCEQYHIKRLSLFGSVLRDDFDSTRSDVDVLIEGEPQEKLTLFDLGALQMDLTDALGRTVDLATTTGLNKHLRHEILATAMVIYERT